MRSIQEEKILVRLLTSKKKVGVKQNFLEIIKLQLFLLNLIASRHHLLKVE